MIRGVVTARHQAKIPVQVRDPQGQEVDLEAMVDTGFSGYLTLPDAVIAALQLAYDRTEIYTIGDNSDVAFDLYVASVVWDGQDRSVFVLATESEPLIGMSMLHDYQLFVDVIDGGDVLIEARP